MTAIAQRGAVEWLSDQTRDCFGGCARAAGPMKRISTQTSSARITRSDTSSAREYSVSGLIDMIVHRSSQIVRLTGDGASGVLNRSP